ncbi:MAG: hypothetical protein AAF821_23370 [Cyanobacteria bacterium P01_D01_bin.156]
MGRLHWGWISLAIALSSCSLPTNQIAAPEPPTSSSTSPVAEADINSCTPMASQVPLQPATDIELPFERFDFRPTLVTETDDTLTFAGNRYSFIFCKRDRTWGVESIPPLAATEEDYANYYEALSNPDYSNITASDGQTYEARVRLDAPWVEGSNDLLDSQEPPLEKVVFELLKPGQATPTATVLYTNTDIVDRELGASAGVPEIAQTLITDSAIWWAIGFEQGEGFSGIATLIQYDLATEQVNILQPDQLDSAQINDMAITTDDDDAITLWLGTQYSGEGNPYLPAHGLVSYQPISNTFQSYTIENSPMTGAIPTQLWVTDKQLWVATGSGVCEVDWTMINTYDNWVCWNFTAMADLPAGANIYASLLDDTPINQVETSTSADILWLAEQGSDTSSDSPLRYEITYQPGITIQIAQGADYYPGPDSNPDDGYFWWPGRNWSWNGSQFVRPWDQVAINYVGGGPNGIGDPAENYAFNWQTMRGEFDLLQITTDMTEIKYYSAWVNAEDIEPWVTVQDADNTRLNQLNPTDAILAELKQTAQ